MFDVVVNCHDYWVVTMTVTVTTLFRLYLIELLFMPVLHSQKVVKLGGYENIT